MSQKWHPIDQAAAMQLAQLAASPGVVMQFSTNALPWSLQGTLAAHF